jgi:hypothetical protein
MIVHLPIALTILTPFFAIGALWAVRRGADVRPAWGLATAMLVLLFASGWVALQTGENEEERVEEVVGESALEGHEEAAELFLWTAGLVVLLAGAGFLRGRIGSVARIGATVGTLALLGAGYNVGHSGGGLVYGQNAGAAYSDAAGGLGEGRGEVAQEEGEGNPADSDRD